MVIEIRKAKKVDAERAFDIRKNSILAKCVGYYSTEVLNKWTSGVASENLIDIVDRYFYVAMVNDTVAATGMINTDDGMIDAIFVEPKFMGLGLAKSVLGYLEVLALKAGLGEVKLDSTLNAAEFYRRRGFSGDSISTYESPKGITLECIPMVKNIAGL